jgi:hypothetical protein
VSEEWGNRRFLHLGFALKRGEQISFFALDGLVRPRGDRLPRDIRHVALTVPSVAPWRGRLRRLGIDFTEEDHGGALSLYFSDPNGVTLELTNQPLTRGEEEDDAGAARTVAAWFRRPRTRGRSKKSEVKGRRPGL